MATPEEEIRKEFEEWFRDAAVPRGGAPTSSSGIVDTSDLRREPPRLLARPRPRYRDLRGAREHRPTRGAIATAVQDGCRLLAAV
jgi:hypothetical protein